MRHSDSLTMFRRFGSIADRLGGGFSERGGVVAGYCDFSSHRTGPLPGSRVARDAPPFRYPGFQLEPRHPSETKPERREGIARCEALRNGPNGREAGLARCKVPPEAGRDVTGRYGATDSTTIHGKAWA